MSEKSSVRLSQRQCVFINQKSIICIVPEETKATKPVSKGLNGNPDTTIKLLNLDPLHMGFPFFCYRFFQFKMSLVSANV